jgi:phospholipase C
LVAKKKQNQEVEPFLCTPARRVITALDRPGRGGQDASMKNYAALLILLFVVPASALEGSSPSCAREAGARPNPRLKAGSRAAITPIKHIIVIMQENHSFDNYFGSLNKPQYYGSAVDGIKLEMFNPDKNGNPIHVYHSPTLCPDDPYHLWDPMHWNYHDGANDGFVTTNENRTWVMSYFNENDLPFYYALANQFAIGDRYFSSVLGPTYPNRFFLLTGTAFGHIQNDEPPTTGFTQKTIFDQMSQYGVNWKYYKDGHGYLELFGPTTAANLDKIGTQDDLKNDLASGNFPEVAFVDFSFEGADEHPDENIQMGGAQVAKVIHRLTESPIWKNSVLFLVYDESGGFFDHVAPPAACVPDDIAPSMKDGDFKAQYDRLGFRVPFVTVSPFAKHHYVSHKVYDHTSILRFIETKFNLPALSRRDANAGNLRDLFDFKHPVYKVNLPEMAAPTRSDCK